MFVEKIVFLLNFFRREKKVGQRLGRGGGPSKLTTTVREVRFYGLPGRQILDPQQVSKQIIQEKKTQN